MGLPKVFFDIEIDGNPSGRIVMEVRSPSGWLHLWRRKNLYILMLLPVSTLKLHSIISVLQLRSDVVPKTAGRYFNPSLLWKRNCESASAFKMGQGCAEVGTGSLKNQFWSQTKQWGHNNWGECKISFPASYRFGMLCWPASFKLIVVQKSVYCDLSVS